MTHRHPTLPIAAAVALAAALAAAAPSAAAQNRGELLYNTHCIACHSTQVHWRDHSQVTDWPSLRAEVRRWQTTARLAWTDDDIDQVALYLNATYYHYTPPARRWVQAGAPTGLALAR